MTKQNENLYSKKSTKWIVLLIYLLTEETLYPKLYLSVSKIGINAFIQAGLFVGGLYEGDLYLICGVTQVLRKMWAYLRGGLCMGGGT